MSKSGDDKMKKKRVGTPLDGKKNLTAYLYLMPSLIGVSVFVLIPFCDAIRRSMFEAMSGKFVWFNNYIELFQNSSFISAVKNTVRFTFTGIPILLVISLFLAIILNSFKKSGEFFKTVFLVPMAVPIASVVFLWQIFFDDYGIINSILSDFSLDPVRFMTTDAAFYVLLFSYLWKNIGYDMILWLAGLTQIPTELYEAAELDGAGPAAKFRYITLPLLKPTMFITVIISLINSFKVFREAYLVAGNYPDKSIYMLQHIFNNWFLKLDIQKMCTAAVLLVAVVSIVIAAVKVVMEWNERKNEKKF